MVLIHLSGNLFPVVSHLGSSFRLSAECIYTLEEEKIKTKLKAGSFQLEAAVTGILNASHTLSEDPRFLPLFILFAAYPADSTIIWRIYPPPTASFRT